VDKWIELSGQNEKG